MANQIVAVALAALVVLLHEHGPRRWREERDPRRHPAGTVRLGLTIGSVLVGAALVVGMAATTDLDQHPPRAVPVLLEPDGRGPGDDVDADDPALATWAAFDEVPPGGAQVLDGVSDVSW